MYAGLTTLPHARTRNAPIQKNALILNIKVSGNGGKEDAHL
jgi:hypothetical protein